MLFPSDSQEFTLSPFDHALIESGYLSLSQIHQALVDSRSTGVALPKVVEAMVGESLPAELHRQYEAQQNFALMVIHGVKFFDQAQLSPLVDPEVIATLISRYLPLLLCRQYGFLPLRHWEESGSLLVVMVDPSDAEAYQFLERQLAPYQLSVQRRGISREDYDNLLDQLYGNQDILKILLSTNPPHDGKRPPATVVDVTEVIEEMPPKLVALQSQPEPEQTAIPETPATPVTPVIETKEDKQVVQLVNKILILGLRESANEIHLDVQENNVLVRIRQGGNLRLLMEPLPKELAPAIVRRLKVMTDLDIHQTQLPQKARLRKSYNSRPAYFFIHILPSFYGENVLVRIVPASEKLSEFTELCGNRQVQHQLQDLGQISTGLVVIAGPTYGGKSTTLEAFLGQQLKQNRTIGSVEDPIRHTHQGITQVEVNPDLGFTAAKAVASLVDQRVNVIAVDGLGDAETTQAVVNALTQGHLVFVTLMAKDGAAAIAQLQQWLPPAVLGEYLRGVVSQRLIRRVCPSCRIKVPASPEQQQRFGLPAETIYQANSLTAEVMEQASIKQRLCPQCHGFGYVGVSGIFEVVPMITPLQQIIRRPCPTADLRLAFQQTGVTSLGQMAIALVAQGVTSLEEVNRVFPKMPDSLLQSPSVTTAPTASETLPPNFLARLQSLENCVTQLNQSLADLKQAIAPTAPPRPTAPKPAAQASPPPKPMPPTVDLLPELEALENLSAQKRSKKEQAEVMDEESTLIRDFADIQELLLDDDLPELDPKDATLVGEIAFPDKDATLVGEIAFPKTDPDPNDPFKTAMDPW
jgi:type IV pilus assembly protein PilB